MDIAEIYAAVLGSFLVLFIGWHIAAEFSGLRHRFTSGLRQRVRYTNVVLRQQASNDFTVATAIQLLVVVGLNVVACTVQVQSSDRSARFARVAFLNMIPLYLGGRTSLLVECFLGLPHPWYVMMHGWMGRICLAQALTHGFLEMNKKTSALGLKDNMFLASGISILVTSLLYLRRLHYEIFLKLHLLLALSFLVLLWLHIGIGLNLATFCVGAASALWSAQTVAWLFRLVYLNLAVRYGHVNDCAIVEFRRNGDAFELHIPLRRPFKVSPGQYVYITESSRPNHLVGLLQAHPYMIAWSTQDDDDSWVDPHTSDDLHEAPSTSISLLIQRRRGFSQMLNDEENSSSLNIILDGPYGRGPPLQLFDKVMYIASGVGIAAHLSSIRQLLKAHDNKSAQARRLCLLWVVDNEDQETWARVGGARSTTTADLRRSRSEDDHVDKLKRLMHLDGAMKRHILSIHIVYNDVETSDDYQPENLIPRMYRWKKPVHNVIRTLIKGEWGAEAGSMAISLCASPSIERTVRATLRTTESMGCTNSWDIKLYTSIFRVENRGYF